MGYRRFVLTFGPFPAKKALATVNRETYPLRPSADDPQSGSTSSTPLP